MSIGLIETAPLFNHHKLFHRVDLQVFIACEEQVNFWWVLLKPCQWSSCNGGNNGFRLEHVVRWCKNDQTSGDQALALLPYDLLPTANEAECDPHRKASSRQHCAVDVDLQERYVSGC